MATKKTFLLRLDPALWDALQAWAGEDLRSVNGQIEYLLREAVQRRGKKLPLPQDEIADDTNPPEDQ